MISSQVFCLSIIYSCLMLLGRQVMCREHSACHNDICLWTNGSDLTQSDAHTACKQRNTFLLRVTNDNIQSKLAEFRNKSGNLLGNHGFWIDVKRDNKGFHWIDGSSFPAGGHVGDQASTENRCAVIANVNGGFIFSARRWDNTPSSYICQLPPQQGMNCTAGELSMNSKCYRKYHERRTWFSASNECLFRNGSLAVFTDTGRPSDNNRLTEWLNASGADKTYWIGLVRSWWKTDGEDIQYSYWGNGHPSADPRCVIVVGDNSWHSYDCDNTGRFVCQNYTVKTTTTTTTTTTKTTTKVSRSSASGSTSSSTTTTSSTNTSSSSAQPGVVRDNTVIIAIAVVAPCLAVVVIVIAVLVYCYKVKNNRNVQRHASDKPPSTDDYATLDRDTPSQQPQYDVIRLDQRHTRRHQTPRDTAADDYVTLDSETQGQQHPYDVIRPMT